MIKEAIISGMGVLLSKSRDKNGIMNSIKSLQLSHQTISRRAQLFSSKLKEKLIFEISKSRAISICLDESTDQKDMSQLIIFIRIVREDNSFIDEIMDLKPLKLTTKAIDIFNVLKESLADHEISFGDITAITTDGAAAMTGSKSGLTALLKRENPLIKSFKCIIHQESLIAKLGISSAKKFADNVMKIVNKIVSVGSLRHRKFKALL